MIDYANNDIGRWLVEYCRSSRFYHRYPLYTFILSQLKPISDPSVDVMAVSYAKKEFRLHVNIEYFAQYPHFIAGVLLHEIHHIVLGHFTNHAYRGLSYPEYLSWAMEVSANEYIKEPLPGRPFRWQDFVHLGMRAGQSTLERYDCLVSALFTGKMDANFPSGTVVDTHDLPNGIGNPQVLTDGAATDANVLRRILRMAAANLECEQGSKALAVVAGKEVHVLLHESDEALSCGSVALGSDRFLGQRAMNPTVDWRTALRRFALSATVRSSDYRWVNRRFPHRIGEVPGRMRKTAPARLLAVIDTSGSVSSAQLERVGDQLRRLRRHCYLSIVECDAQIHRVYPFEGKISYFRGGGGTDLRPPFEKRFLKEHRADALAYFTDGAGPFPQENPGIPTLWVLIESISHFNRIEQFTCPWGKRISLPS